MSLRVYLPTTWAGLRSLVTDQDWSGVRASLAAVAVLADGDAEDDEYAALMTAADASTALVHEAGEAGLRRVVGVAEIAALEAEVAWSDVVAVHLDTEPRQSDDDPDDDLAWFAPQELPQLL